MGEDSSQQKGFYLALVVLVGLVFVASFFSQQPTGEAVKAKFLRSPVYSSDSGFYASSGSGREGFQDPAPPVPPTPPVCFGERECPGSNGKIIGKGNQPIPAGQQICGSDNTITPQTMAQVTQARQAAKDNCEKKRKDAKDARDRCVTQGDTDCPDPDQCDFNKGKTSDTGPGCPILEAIPCEINTGYTTVKVTMGSGGSCTTGPPRVVPASVECTAEDGSISPQKVYCTPLER